MRVFSELLMGSCKTILRFLVMLVGGLQVDSGTEHTKRHRKSRYLELEIFIIYFNLFHVRLFFEIEVSENPKNQQISRFPLKILSEIPKKTNQNSWKIMKIELFFELLSLFEPFHRVADGILVWACSLFVRAAYAFIRGHNLPCYEPKTVTNSRNFHFFDVRDFLSSFVGSRVTG